MAIDALQILQAAGMTILEDIDRAAFLANTAPAIDHLGAVFGAEAVTRFRAAVG